MRLLDADSLRQDWLENGETKNGIICVTQRLIPFYKAIDTSPTIDPETLPIVQELKQQIAEITKERDAAVDALENVAMFDDSLCRYCALSDKCGLDQNESCMRFEWKGVNNHE